MSEASLLSGIIDLLKAASIAVFAVLALTGVAQWYRRRGAAGLWLALMATSLAVVVIAAASPLLPEPSDPAHVVIRRVVGAVLLCVPYLQYRFMATFSPRRHGEEIAVGAATAAVVLGVLLVPDFAVRGQPYTPFFAVFVATGVGYWTMLSLYAALRLWADGRSQTTAARMRMYTLGAGSLGMATALVVWALSSSVSTNKGVELALNLLALVSGAILLIGFAPPSALRARWRRREGTRSWQLAAELMEASSAVEVAGPCVRYASRLFSGRGAILIGGDGSLLGVHGFEPEQARTLAAEVAARNATGDDPASRSVPCLLGAPCGGGWLVVQPSAYTPFFGDEESHHLRDVAALVGLALTRAGLHQQVRSSHQQLAEAQSLAAVGSWEWDSATDTVWWSDEQFRLHGLTLQPTSSLAYADVVATVHPDDRALFATIVGAAVKTGGPFAFEHRVVHPDGTVLRLHARGKVRGGGPGQPVRLLGTCQDITERRGLEEAVAHGALHDPLTGLANRMLFTERLSRALTRVEQGDDQMAVLLLDLDDFAAVNDTLGTTAGDEALRQVAERLKELARPVDTVARLGADQFAMLLEDTDVVGTTILAERIRTDLARSLAVAGGEIVVQASIGIAAGVCSTSASEFLRNADAALRAAKGAGKNGYRIFENGMHDQLSRRVALRADLQRAVPDGQLWLAYQPVVSLRNGAVLAVEALARWEHPQRGPVAPSEFIPIAEDSGMIVPIGQWVLREAVAQVCAWRERVPGLERLGLHINVSARELQQRSLVEGFAAVLEASELDPGLLTVEITESVLMGEDDASVGALEGLRCLGVGVAIDDFGTGYSSLSYLRRLPVDTLKIDKAFIDEIAVGPEEAALARAIIKIGDALQLSVVAEGVETLDQANRLRTMGCTAAQGFLFSRPLPADRLLDLIAVHADGAVAAG